VTIKEKEKEKEKEEGGHFLPKSHRRRSWRRDLKNTYTTKFPASFYFFLFLSFPHSFVKRVITDHLLLTHVMSLAGYLFGNVDEHGNLDNDLDEVSWSER
jgi:hypothetical protein